MTTTATTTTATVSDAEYRSFRADLRRMGYFVTGSSMVAGGYRVTYVTDPR